MEPQYPNNNQHYSYGYQQPPSPYPPKTNGKAITALVLGILAITIPYLGFIIGIIAIIFASLAFKEIKQRQEQGRGLAIAGLVCGIIGTALYAIIIILFVVAFAAFSGFESNYYY
ncbi:DUF4190 domain-containing protein [Paenibacillus sp. J5C_2022]|uniref:DUF4190 domain-containing protein n=1 Tax=Paenibacillus sp. J5C2022 TaxID=2977129 RepID=UPI0021CFE1DB|nr:DUF4190 domain-containing protein [Paenibacillus sp. J5C2022]MCU6707734.1 DUF4190 domain-containing protein [Paenibacillus sp. J5C2022]